MTETESTHDVAVATEGMLQEGAKTDSEANKGAGATAAKSSAAGTEPAAEGAPKQVQPDGR